ncbi:hypothetical protein Tco_1432419 [Tanacetum coccineum]
MAEEQDEQQQQNLLDAELVPINKQVKIEISNFRIALEKPQPNFWYSVTYDLTAKEYLFKIDDQVFKVDANLIRNTLWITPKDLDHPFTPAAPEFTKLIIKYTLSQNDQVSKRPLYFQHVIKLDATLGNLKLENKGTKDPIFGMDIPVVMFNDNIKAFAEYSEHLAKSKRSKPIKATCRGKGLLTKQGVEIAVERVSIPKRRRSKTIIKEVGQFEEVVDDDVNSDETEDDKEEPLFRRRPTGVFIGGEVHKELDEERVDHSNILKGLETLSEATQYKLNMKKAIKASKDDFFIQQRLQGSGEGSGMTLEVPDEHNLKSSNEGAVVCDTPKIQYAADYTTRGVTSQFISISHRKRP